jgi:hypothetical protein
MNKKCVLALVWVVLSAVPIVGQNSRVANEAIKQLAATLEGDWAIQITLAGNERHPGSDGHGEEKFSRGPGGNSFVEKYHSTGTEGKITGLGIFWPDKAQGAYQILWCGDGTPDGCTPMSGGGKWEAGNLVIRQQFERKGKQVALKEVFSEFTASSFLQTIFEKIDDGEWKARVMIRATRIKTEQKAAASRTVR